MSELTLPHRARRALGTASRAIERSQGVPAWALVPAVLGGGALVIAVVGLFWDVAYHIDHGRDAELFTLPHVLILVGLMGLLVTAATAVVLATADGRAGWALGPLRIPFFALPLGAMATGAVLGFPLDDLWHQTYGVDVTLWSPTHVLMIGGAVLTTFALALIPAEAGLHAGGRLPRWRRVALAGAPAIGLSVFTLEFDFGVPQWQALFHPLLVVAGLTLTLCAAREALGRGGALAAALFFLGMRAGLALLLGGVLGHTVPMFPIALGIALCVEAGYLVAGRRHPVVLALVCGGLAATVGLATEWAWQDVTGRLPWTPELLPMLWVPVLGALAAAVVGVGLGRVEAGRPGLRAPLVLAALAVLIALLVVPLPRRAPVLAAHVTTTPVGAPRSVIDRFGVPSREQDVAVEVTVDRPDQVRGADWFMVMAWQGGGERNVRLVEVAPGRYRSAGAVPTGGSWKDMVFLARGDVLAGVPVAFPPDPTSHFGGYPLTPARDARFVPSSQLLMSETHGGPPWVAMAAYAALLATVATWLGLLLLAHRAVARRTVQ